MAVDFPTGGKFACFILSAFSFRGWCADAPQRLISSSDPGLLGLDFRLFHFHENGDSNLSPFSWSAYIMQTKLTTCSWRHTRDNADAGLVYESVTWPCILRSTCIMMHTRVDAGHPTPSVKVVLHAKQPLYRWGISPVGDKIKLIKFGIRDYVGDLTPRMPYIMKFGGTGACRQYGGMYTSRNYFKTYFLIRWDGFVR